jgi:CRP-like cAMP-binding protein
VATVGTDEDYYEMLTHGRATRHFSVGEYIFKKDEPGESMFIVRTGSVEIRDGDRVIETIAAPGLFGEMALIDREPRTLSAVAATETELVEIPARHFWVLVHETPYFAQLVMGVMARRLIRAGGTT